MIQYNLDSAIYDAAHDRSDKKYDQLNDAQVSAFLSLIGAKCRKDTKEKLDRRLRIPLSLWKRYGIFSRVILTDNDVEYICGQSWTDEMRTLRECIL